MALLCEVALNLHRNCQKRCSCFHTDLERTISETEPSGSESSYYLSPAIKRGHVVVRPAILFANAFGGLTFKLLTRVDQSAFDALL